MVVENYLQPILAGFIAGFIVAVPVGPVNLTVINQALRRGFFAAFLIGIGAMCAETVYAASRLAIRNPSLGTMGLRLPCVKA